MEPDHAWLLTPGGAGAIAVIRIRGSGVGAALAAHFSRPVAEMRCVHGELRGREGDVIDDPIVVLIDALTADINLHGGGAVIRATLALFESLGFAVEVPSLDEANGADVIVQEMHAALRLPLTKVGLALLLAQPAAWAAMRSTPTSAAAALADRTLERLLHPPTVALIGVPNVGKSTLANQLFGQARSIVLDQPGTTRDYVNDLADLNGMAVHLVDTPGRRSSSDLIEAAAIRLSDPVIAAADLCIIVLDPTQSPEPQMGLIAQYPDALLVANKSDLAAQWQSPAKLRIAARSGLGIADLVLAIHRRLGVITPEIIRALPWTQRQHRLLELEKSKQ